MNNFQHQGLGGEFDPVQALREANPGIAGAVEVVGRRLIVLDNAVDNILRATGLSPEIRAHRPDTEQYSGYLVNGEPQPRDAAPASTAQSDTVTHVDFQERKRLEDARTAANALARPSQPASQSAPDPEVARLDEYRKGIDRTVEDRYYGKAA